MSWSVITGQWSVVRSHLSFQLIPVGATSGCDFPQAKPQRTPKAVRCAICDVEYAPWRELSASSRKYGYVCSSIQRAFFAPSVRPELTAEGSTKS